MAGLIIVSGGQTGVDRGALDAALAAGAEAGGWCPEGRLAEDGVIPPRYPLRELPGGDYLARTRRNVQDSDATLIIGFGPLTGGTARTLEFCRLEARPWFVIDATETPVEEALEPLVDFVRRHRVRVLNVAGPRASGEPRAHAYARSLIAALLTRSSPSQVGLKTGLP